MGKVLLDGTRLSLGVDFSEVVEPAREIGKYCQVVDKSCIDSLSDEAIVELVRSVNANVSIMFVNECSEEIK